MICTIFTIIIFMAFKYCVNMIIKIVCLREWFTTWFTIVIFMAFMNCVEVFLQIACMSKWFATSVTFIIFMVFKNCVNVFFQIVCFVKWLRILIFFGFHELCKYLFFKFQLWMLWWQYFFLIHRYLKIFHE